MYCVDVTVFECIKDPLCSPLAETRFAGMPRTDLFVSEHDVLRDEGVAYHRALQRGGVNSTLRFLKGSVGLQSCPPARLTATGWEGRSHFFVLSQMDEISHAFVD
jgi:acetyl esterase/lipase